MHSPFAIRYSLLAKPHFQRLCCKHFSAVVVVARAAKRLQANVAYFVAAMAATCHPQPFSMHHSVSLSHILVLDLAREFLISQPQELLSAGHKSLSCVSLILSPVGLSSPSPLHLPVLPFAVGTCNTCRMHTIITQYQAFFHQFHCMFFEKFSKVSKGCGPLFY